MFIKLPDLIGLTEDEATKKIAKEGLESRIVRRDGKSYMGITDLRLDRVNLEIEKGKVVKARLG